MSDSAADRRWMSVALALGRRGLGTTAPNPSVGCVLVREGRVVGRGWTRPGGRPHAETEALGRAGAEASGATAYVTLEPCAHHGRTSPCADALIEAGVARVVAALEDPDSRVAGSGLARLAAAGIAVKSGVCADRAAYDLGGYLMRQRAGRPRISLKLATSLDGRIATASGDSRWITGALARARGHALRASHDAVMIGIGTALADDPMLTCRLPGVERRAPRIVLDSQARLPADSCLAQTAAQHPVWQFSTVGEAAGETAGETLGELPVRRFSVDPDSTGRPDPEAVAAALGAEGLNDVLVEGGGQVAASLMRAGLADRLYWFRAGLVLGGDARPAVGDLGLDQVADAGGWRLRSRKPYGSDLLEIWHREREAGSSPAQDGPYSPAPCSPES